VWSEKTMTKRKWVCGNCEHENCSCKNTCEACGDRRGNNKGWTYLVDGKSIRKMRK